MTIAVIKYNAGNTGSVMNALRRLGADPVLTDDADEMAAASHVIFPGVGEASSAMGCLREQGLDRVIVSLTQPVLGICLGMQLLCDYSEENSTECLGIIPQTVKRFESGVLKVPHIGWNTVEPLWSSPLVEGAAGWAYFVHGYYVPVGAETTAVTDYGVSFSAAVSVGNFHATQFHPEKSGDLGTRILRNFLAL